MTKRKLYLRLSLLALFPLALLLVYIASHNPKLVEHFYSNGLYRLLGQYLSRITGLLPFSVGEILVLCTFFFLIYKLAKFLFEFFVVKTEIKRHFTVWLINLCLGLSILYFSFLVVWGFNYHRLSFAEIAHLDTTPATVSELANLCEDLIVRSNKVRSMLNEDMAGIMDIPQGVSSIFSSAPLGFYSAAEAIPQLSGKYGKPKGVLLSELMCYAGISGIYFPFTGEANVNTKVPDFMLPSTTAHEMAHQRGFSREDEANYIAYITCSFHPDMDFKYSGLMLALIHSMNALYTYDQEGYMRLYEQYSDGLKRDMSYLRKFWSRYEGPVERASEKLNNAYLKSNMQEDGVHSYGRMVDLLIAEYRLNKASE